MCDKANEDHIPLSLLAVEFDSFAYACEFFTSGVDANNGYGCDHPNQWETQPEEDGREQGCCFSWSCPLGFEAEQEDLECPIVDWSEEDPAGEVMESEYLLVQVDAEATEEQRMARVRYLHYINRYNDPKRDRKRRKEMSNWILLPESIARHANLVYGTVDTGRHFAGLEFSEEEISVIRAAVSSVLVPHPGWSEENLFHTLCRMNQESYNETYSHDKVALELEKFNPQKYYRKDGQLLKSLKCYLYNSCYGAVCKTGLYRVLRSLDQQIQQRIIRTRESYRKAAEEIHSGRILSAEYIGSIANLIYQTIEFGYNNTQVSIDNGYQVRNIAMKMNPDARRLDDRLIFLALDDMYLRSLKQGHIHHPETKQDTLRQNSLQLISDMPVRDPVYGSFRNDPDRILRILEVLLEESANVPDQYQELYEAIGFITRQWRENIIDSMPEYENAVWK